MDKSKKEKTKIYKTDGTIDRNKLFEFASLFGVPVSKETLDDEGTDIIVYKVGDVELELDAEDAEFLQLIESQIEGTDMKTAYRKRGSAPSAELN